MTGKLHKNLRKNSLYSKIKNMSGTAKTSMNFRIYFLIGRIESRTNREIEQTQKSQLAEFLIIF